MKIKKPTRSEIREVRRIQREREKLRDAENAACRALVEKYVPCQIGDIIEGGTRHVEQGRVVSRACYVFDGGVYDFRVYYMPLRGKKFLKNSRSFNDMSTIRVIKPAKT